MTNDPNDVFTAICLMLAVVGALILMIAPKGGDYDRLNRLGLGFFVGGMGGTVAFFLLTSPDVLVSIRKNIGLALIGMVIAFFGIIRLLK